MSLAALKAELLNTTPFAHLGRDLRPVPQKPGKRP